MRKNKKKQLYGILFFIFLCMGIGYAALTTNLAINGTANIPTVSWDIHFNNIQVKTGSVTPDSAANIDTATSVSYEVTLAEPGDFYEFNVDVVNAGTIDGMISSITSKLNNVVITTLPTYLDYSITYYDDKPILLNHLLAAGATETLKVRISYKTDIDPDDLPDTDQQLNLNFTITYTQADENAILVDHSVTVYTFNTTTTNINQPIPDTVTTYTSTDPLCSPGAYKMFLKHVLLNGVIKESYSGICIPSTNFYISKGINPGIYYLKGAVNESNLSSKPVFNSNKAVLESIGLTMRTNNGSSVEYYNAGAYLSAFLSTSGQVCFTPYSTADWVCCVESNGSSKCFYYD